MTSKFVNNDLLLTTIQLVRGVKYSQQWSCNKFLSSQHIKIKATLQVIVLTEKKELMYGKENVCYVCRLKFLM